jgi:hypothetical protein
MSDQYCKDNHEGKPVGGEMMGGGGGRLGWQIFVVHPILKRSQNGNTPRKDKVEQLKRGRGRPKGSVKMTIQRFADNPPLVLPKTDHQRLKELKELMIRSGGKDVAQKVIEIALNDEHPHQLVALKMCLDRTLPVSLFEKDKSQRSAVTINITGLGQEPTIIDEQPEDVEAKYG